MMKHIIYASSCFPEALYNDLATRKLDQQAQKFNRLVMKGFRENGWDVTATSYLSSIPFEQCPLNYIQNGVRYQFLRTPRRRYAARLHIVLQCYRRVKECLLRNSDAIVGCDILNISVSLGALLAAKKMHRRAIGFVTDVPEILSEDHHSISTWINNRVMSLCTDYVFLTKQMQELIPTAGKRFAVVEGLTDVDIPVKRPEKQPHDRKIVLYAGSLHRKYGIADLIAAFIEAAVTQAELHIYGDGDYRTEVEKICQINPSIRYFGVVDNKKIVPAEQQADLLINPRMSAERFTRYSFPSKVIEYMSSGTPLLMNMLPGIPEEYSDYCFRFASETHEGYVHSLRDVLSLPDEALEKMGHAAAKFVATEKSCRWQICRAIQELGLL